MTTLTPIPKDYKPPEGGDFKTFEDGVYNVKTMKWATKDDSGNPILVKSENKPEMYGRLNFTLEDGSEGPPMTVELYNMPLLAIAFTPNAKLPNLPEETEAGKVSSYMWEIEKIVNGSGVVKEATVKKGWVNFITGMEIPTDKFYYWRILQVVSKNENGEISWYKHLWPDGGSSDLVKIVCEVLAESQGKETSFKGSRFILSFDYGFKYDENTGQVDWAKTEQGAWKLSAKRASTLYQITAPTMFDPFEPDNLQNVIPYWVKHANLPSIPLLGFLQVKQSKSGFRYYQVDFEQIEAVDNFVVKETVTRPEPATDEELDVKARNVFKEAMDFLTGDNSMNENWEPTDLGVETAKKYLTPLKKSKTNPQGKIVGKEFKSLTFEDVSSYMSALIDSLEQDTEERKKLLILQEKLELSLVGLEDNIMEIDEDDIPF